MSSGESVAAAVVVASASAVAKLFVIGGAGFISAKRPKGNEIIPHGAMTAMSRMSFNLLILPLVFSTMASVTPQKVESLWFVLVAGIFVICLSYTVAALLEKIPCFRVDNKLDMEALKVAAAFPNIVALPILIFPALCEFDVVHEAFGEGSTEEEMFRSCVDESNSMIFVYFFSWNLLYWLIGFSRLVKFGEAKRLSAITSRRSVTLVRPAHDDAQDDLGDTSVTGDEMTRDGLAGGTSRRSLEPLPSLNDLSSQSQDLQNKETESSRAKQAVKLVLVAFKNTMTSPGFIAMVLGFITACIEPLRSALFSAGGSLRFLGSALQSLGGSSASVGTLLVAASLVHPTSHATHEGDGDKKKSDDVVDESEQTKQTADNGATQRTVNLRDTMERNRSSIIEFSSRSLIYLRQRKPTIRMHLWFTLSRLVVSPAVVSGLMIALECGGVLNSIPGLAKLVVIVNSCLPGAQLIVVTLESKGLLESASVVAECYLPSYLICIFTIACWCSLGLMIALPQEDGASFCAS